MFMHCTWMYHGIVCSQVALNPIVCWTDNKRYKHVEVKETAPVYRCHSSFHHFPRQSAERQTAHQCWQVSGWQPRNVGTSSWREETTDRTLPCTSGVSAAPSPGTPMPRADHCTALAAQNNHTASQGLENKILHRH